MTTITCFRQMDSSVGQHVACTLGEEGKSAAIITVSSFLSHLIWEHDMALPLALPDYLALDYHCFSSMPENDIFHFTLKVSSSKYSNEKMV